jgi:uncharacterized protein (DUF362 family)
MKEIVMEHLPEKENEVCVSRRTLLKMGGVAAWALMGPGCAHQMKNRELDLSKMAASPSFRPHGTAAFVKKGETGTAYALFKKTLEAATDFSWLTRGDSVLIKIALNSAHTFPATSDPWALNAMISILKEKGARRILVGDSSGVESVHWTKERRKGSSRSNCQKAGLLSVIEEARVYPFFFEEGGYDAFFPGEPQGPHHWKEPIYVTKAVTDVDHIVYLCRVSSHVMADITSGMKTGVGFLREDSRKALHCGGEAFYSMYEEINTIPEIASRLRLVVSSGTKVLATFGPDNGHVTHPETGLFIASEDLLAHEMIAYAFLLYNREFETSIFETGVTGHLTRIRSLINRGFVSFIWEDGSFIKTPTMPLFIPGNIYAHPSVVTFMKRKGGIPGQFQFETVNAPDGSSSLKEYLTRRTAPGSVV